MELKEFIPLMLVWLFAQCLLLLPDEMKTAMIHIASNAIVLVVIWRDYKAKIKQIKESKGE